MRSCPAPLEEAREGGEAEEEEGEGAEERGGRKGRGREKGGERPPNPPNVTPVSSSPTSCHLPNALGFIFLIDTSLSHSISIFRLSFSLRGSVGPRPCVTEPCPPVFLWCPPHPQASSPLTPRPWRAPSPSERAVSDTKRRLGPLFLHMILEIPDET